MVKAGDLSFLRVKSNVGEVVPEAISEIFIFQSLWCSPISSWIMTQSLIKSLLVFHSSSKQDTAANTSSYKNNLKESPKHACTWMQTFGSPPKQIPSGILHASQALGNVPSVSKELKWFWHCPVWHFNTISGLSWWASKRQRHQVTQY